MLVESENLVSVEKLQSDLPKYLKGLRNGNGPVAVIKNSEVIAYLVPPELAEVIHEPGIEKLLAERMKGKTVPHEEVMAEAKRRIQRARRRS